MGSICINFYVLPPNEVIDKMNNFKSALDSQIDAEQNTEVKALKVKDADFFTRNCSQNGIWVYMVWIQ